MEETPKIEKKRVYRARVKKTLKVPTKMALPVKAVWEAATPEEREKAHQTAALMLEYWTGRAKKEEVAAKLGVPPLRVWQMSQQALSGMAAGLVKQPRSRKKQNALLPPEEDPKALNKKIQGLEKDLDLMKDLVKLLRDLPGNRDAMKKSDGIGKKKKHREPRQEDGVVPDKEQVLGEEGASSGTVGS